MTIPPEVHELEHLVETQWHYPIMTRYGWTADTKSAKGLVRQYQYSKGYKTMRVCTGVNADYWISDNDQGYHGSLEAHLKKTNPDS